MEIKYHKLENGLTVATDQMNEIESVTVVIQVKTGSQNEKDNQGISHFLEHMAFKGTKNRTALQIAKEFDRIGGHFNAYTSLEKTVYYARMLRKDIETGASILADILQNSLFEDAEIEREKDVILQEIAQTNDDPYSIVFDLFHETAFPNQAFGRSILGSVESVKAVTRNQIVDYVNNNYYCENILISAAGKINHPEFVDIINDKFNQFPKNGNKYVEDVFYKGGEIRIERDLEQVNMVLGFESIPYTDSAYFDAEVLALIAGGGMSSRLFQEVREKRGLAYSINASSSCYSKTGLFCVGVATSSDKINECIDVIADELLKLTHLINDDEIEAAKSQIYSLQLMSLESSTYRAEKLSSNLGAYGRYLYNEEIMERINSIDKISLTTFANKLFSKNTIPTLATIGKLDKLYNYEDVKLKFG